MSDWTQGEYSYRQELIFEIRLIWAHLGADSSMEDFYDLDSMDEAELEGVYVGARNWHWWELQSRVAGRTDALPSPAPVEDLPPLPLAAHPTEIQNAILARAARRVLHPFYRWFG